MSARFPLEGQAPAPGVRRRQVLGATGAALAAITLGFHAGAARSAGAVAAPSPGDGPAELAPNAWLRLAADGTVTVLLAHTEMGQGTATGLAMIVAEELDADWSRVRTHTIEPDGKRFMITGGSYAMSNSWKGAREAGAALRQILLMAAARQWEVPPEQCRTEPHEVRHEASGRRLTYGELVRLSAGIEAPKEPPLKAPAQYRLIGRPLDAQHVRSVVTGQARHGLDLRVPGMLFAVIERSPVVNGRVRRFDDAACRRVPGVVDVRPVRGTNFPGELYVRDGVAVIARSTWAAMQGRRALQVQWNEDGWTDRRSRGGTLASSQALDADFRLALDGGKPVPPQVIRPAASATRTGTAQDMEAAFAQAAVTVQAEYDVPLQAHVPMEPMDAIAHWQGDRCEVWAPCHFQSRLLNQLRQLTGLPPDKLVIHTPLLGGSFGRRLEPDYAVEAVMLSRDLGRPVQVVWTREDDIRCGLFSPPSRHRLRVAMNAQGDLLALEHSFASLSVRIQTEPQNIRPDGVDATAVFDAVKFPYAVAQHHVSQRLVEQTIRVFWWRRGFTANHTFANESMLDECAHAVRQDPLQLRLKLLSPARVITYDNDGDPELVDTGRLARVLQAACDAADWGRPLPAGMGRGLAFTVTDTYVAQVVEVETRGGVLRVTRVVSAVDCGRVINPQLVSAQVEGSVVFGLTAALKGQITLEEGRVQQSNFHDYPLLRLDEMPQVHTVLPPSEAAPTGIGEPASHPVAAALANAVFAATGQRLRRLPLQLSA